MNVNGINNGSYMLFKKGKALKRETQSLVSRTALTEYILL